MSIWWWKYSIILEKTDLSNFSNIQILTNTIVNQQTRNIQNKLVLFIRSILGVGGDLTWGLYIDLDLQP